jgi:histidyl-tRNA synthetase
VFVVILCLLIFFIISGDIIKTLKDNGYEYTWGNVTVMLAEAFGFCWGVERAVQIAYEARKQFPDDKIWITNEIIHNPTVNKVYIHFLLSSTISQFFQLISYTKQLMKLNHCPAQASFYTINCLC